MPNSHAAPSTGLSSNSRGSRKNEDVLNYVAWGITALSGGLLVSAIVRVVVGLDQVRRRPPAEPDVGRDDAAQLSARYRSQYCEHDDHGAPPGGEPGRETAIVNDG